MMRLNPIAQADCVDAGLGSDPEHRNIDNCDELWSCAIAHFEDSNGAGNTGVDRAVSHHGPRISIVSRSWWQYVHTATRIKPGSITSKACTLTRCPQQPHRSRLPGNCN